MNSSSSSRASHRQYMGNQWQCLLGDKVLFWGGQKYTREIANHINRQLDIAELRGQIKAIERGCLPSCLIAMKQQLAELEADDEQQQ